MNKRPMLSVYIVTYNHGKYLRQALNSVLMQKTKYSFEILVGDDYSSDDTREILKEYDSMYPNKFSIFYRDHNMYYECPNNFEDLQSRCKGKYMILLEGDDFWTDEYKIEKQIDFLENHPEYYAVSHNCTVVGEDSCPNGEKYPECKENEYTYRHFFSGILPGQTATVMHRNFLYDSTFHSDYPKRPKDTPGDKVLYYMLIVNGRIYCMQQSMSAYRHITSSGTSFSATHSFNFRNEEGLYYAMKSYTQRYKPEWLIYVKMLFFINMLRGKKKKQINMRIFFSLIRNEKMFSVIPVCIKYFFKKYFLKNDILVG